MPAIIKTPYELLSHTADFKLKVYGNTLQELFANALKAMFEICEPKKQIPLKKVEQIIQLNSSNYKFLLVEFLSECLYFSDAYNEIFDDIKIENLTENNIKAKIYGYKIDGFNGPEIKAVTYHDVSLEKQDNIWQAIIVFDI